MYLDVDIRTLAARWLLGGGVALTWVCLVECWIYSGDSPYFASPESRIVCQPCATPGSTLTFFAPLSLFTHLCPNAECWPSGKGRGGSNHKGPRRSASSKSRHVVEKGGAPLLHYETIKSTHTRLIVLPSTQRAACVSYRRRTCHARAHVY
ncbi:hypothetical protein K437DRAFT_39991 [Tilletiaria anomala UBC 951]|uniref:Uncharacterized protein n=1 Tax=Tilletiaria anomala (strain ATCC 24038 / CBS 436.72 / UBC 951) TaxID=1037660 RepID=A0A066WHT8_TILAU|nr:uncharacterized protein K437DRAFT_39991 [Tilletiaria anomala UBC 951]KDN52098.1 hypothetical protein K437DRAFT_39991 [Tilletiaria anomala UBC 951]